MAKPSLVWLNWKRGSTFLTRIPGSVRALTKGFTFHTKTVPFSDQEATIVVFWGIVWNDLIERIGQSVDGSVFTLHVVVMKEWKERKDERECD